MSNRLQSEKNRQYLAYSDKAGLSPLNSEAKAFDVIVNAALNELKQSSSCYDVFDAKSLHQVRVSLRKLDTILKLFPKKGISRQGEKIISELKYFRQKLSRARELDVFIGELLVPIGVKFRGDSGFRKLYLSYKKERDAEYLKAKEALSKKRFHKLIGSVARLTAEPFESEKKAANRRRLACRAISEGLSSLRKRIMRTRRLNTLSNNKLHKLRLNVKRMRYALESLDGIYPGKGRRRNQYRALVALERLQHCLGSINDLRSAKKLLVEATSKFSSARPKNTAPRPSKTRFESIILRDYAKRVAKLLQQSAHYCDQFCHTKPFWL